MDIVSRQRLMVLIHLAELRSLNEQTPEAELIGRVAEECHFPKHELKNLINSPEPLASFGALSPKQKQLYMNNICELVALKELDAHKKLFCQGLAYELNFNLDQYKKLVNSYKGQRYNTSSTLNSTNQEVVNSVA